MSNWFCKECNASYAPRPPCPVCGSANGERFTFRMPTEEDMKSGRFVSVGGVTDGWWRCATRVYMLNGKQVDETTFWDKCPEKGDNK